MGRTCFWTFDVKTLIDPATLTGDVSKHLGSSNLHFAKALESCCDFRDRSLETTGPIPPKLYIPHETFAVLS